MLFVMVCDVCVIFVKFVDCLYNMCMFGVVLMEKCCCVVWEMFDIYVLIVYWFGLNNMYCELQDMSFVNFNLYCYVMFEKVVKVVCGNCCEVISKIFEVVQCVMVDVKIDVEIIGCEKIIYSVYCKMCDKQLLFLQVFDVYGFCVVVDSLFDCYMCIGVLYVLYKLVFGKFKDYIVILKINGYQLLYMMFVGLFGVLIEFQVCMCKMYEIVEVGVVVYWLYKNGSVDFSDVQKCVYQWLKLLFDIQSEVGDLSEFFEYVKIDLFFDVVYVFMLKLKIMVLLCGVMVFDFVYLIYSDFGNQCVVVKINNELLLLCIELKSGDIVEVIIVLYLKLNFVWLGFVCIGKVCLVICYYLKMMCLNEFV